MSLNTTNGADWGGALDLASIIANSTVCKSCLSNAGNEDKLFTIKDGKRSFHKHIRACEHDGTCDECNCH